MATPTLETTMATPTTEQETTNVDNSNVARDKISKNIDEGNSNNRENGDMNGTSDKQEVKEHIQNNKEQQQQQNSTETKNGIITITQPTKKESKKSQNNPQTTSEKIPQSKKEETKKKIVNDNRQSSNLSTNSEGSSTPLPSLTDPNAIRFKFLFANHDGLNVHIDCKLTDTVGEVKGALLSVWPEGLPDICESDRIRLICMGRGFLMPDSRNLKDCSVPVFKTHATPINVSIKPKSLHSQSNSSSDSNKNSKYGGILSSGSNNNVSSGGGSGRGGLIGGNGNGTARQGCACVIS